MISKTLYSMQIKTGQDFELNLKQVEDFVAQCGKNAIICTPEVVLSGFVYQRMQEASDFSKLATERLLESSAKYQNTLITTMIEKRNQKFYNNLKVFHKGEVVHKQSKHKLFLGDEQLHFKSGDRGEIATFELDGLKCAALICFELRFVELWEQIRGADVIFISAQWGKARKNHFEILSQALAIANQAFVVASDSANDTMAKGSAIITPYGIMYKNDKKSYIAQKVDISEAWRMRKYLNVGIPTNNA